METRCRLKRWICLCASILFFHAHARANPSVPALARICKVRVGYDTREEMERRLGPGEPQIGGHPRGARVWKATGAGCCISVDAFHHLGREWRADGQVLDTVLITPFAPGAQDRGSDLPEAKVSRRQTFFMGVAGLGMSKAEVLGALKNRLSPPRQEGGVLSWVATGFVRVDRRNKVVTKSWSAQLRFEDDKLREIKVEADVGYEFGHPDLLKQGLLHS